MNRAGSAALPRAALAVGGAFLLSQAIGLAIAPRETTPPCAICIEYKLDPNTASRSELELLPGIGPGMADRILNYRARSTSQPAFRRAEDLDAVDRIGEATVERLRPHLVFPAKTDDQP